jgi:heme-degrading monooxygenase HmoA
VIPAWHLAQINLAYARGDEDDPVMAGFMAQLDEINALADRSPGFLWRHLTDSRDPGQRELADKRVLFNMSVWDSVESLHAFAYKTQHAKVFAARKKWFADWKDHVGSLAELGEGSPFLALWWVPAGHLPTPAEGLERLRMLRARGPHPHAFTFKCRFTPEGEPAAR